MLYVHASFDDQLSFDIYSSFLTQNKQCIIA